jgi:hypothetical protein
MAIHRDRLQTALSLIKRVLQKERDRWWWHTTSTFDKFSTDIEQPLMYSKIKIDDDLKKRYARMHGRLQPIPNDLRTLLTMLHQANWQKKMAIEHHLGLEYNMQYGSALADAFITKYRSAYDTIARALVEIIRDRGQPPKPSFTELREICTEDKYVKILGDDLARLIQSCDWYDPLLKARNGIVHYNLGSSSFMHHRILFQIHAVDECKLPMNLINIPEVMFNENLVDFELYAAVHIGYTFWLLEEFANLGYNILQVTKYPNSEKTMMGYAGLDVFKDSIEKVLAEQL